MTKLEPCKICKSEAELIDVGFMELAVRCTKKNCKNFKIKCSSNNPSDVTEEWNRRVNHE